MTRNENGITHNYAIGLILIVIGGILLLETFDIMNIGKIAAEWWPLILVFVGVAKLKGVDKTSGAVLFVVGIVLLLVTLQILNWASIIRFWPLILIAFGLSIIMRSRGHKSRTKHEKTQEDFVRTITIFGGLDRKVKSDNFRGGDIVVLFGGVELDLRQVKFQDESCQLSLTALFGGIDVKVSSDVQVSVSGAPIFGGIENNTETILESGESPRLNCHCTVAFGGVELRN